MPVADEGLARDRERRRHLAGRQVLEIPVGAAAFGATYGSAASVIQLTSAFGPAVIGVLRDSFGSYRPGLAIASVVTLTACMILFTGGRLAARSS